MHRHQKNSKKALRDFGYNSVPKSRKPLVFSAIFVFLYV